VIVGNGSVDPPRGGWVIYRSVYSLLRGGIAGRGRGRRVYDDDRAPIMAGLDKEISQRNRSGGRTTTAAVTRIKDVRESGRKFRVPNPLACLWVVTRCRGSLIVVLINAANAAVKAVMQVSLGAQCAKIYGLQPSQAGLTYIPSGVGGSIGAYAAGESCSFLTSVLGRIIYSLSSPL